MKRLLAVLLMSMTSLAMASEPTIDSHQNEIDGSLNSNNNNVTHDNSNTSVVGDTYSGQNVAHNQTKVMNTPPATAPVITTGYDTCSTAVSGGASGPGFGISFGKNNRDKTCELLKLTKQLQTMGLNDAAVALLMQDDRVADAIKVAYPELHDKLHQAKPKRRKKR